MPVAPHLLIVEARFYDDLADELLSGAVNALDDVTRTLGAAQRRYGGVLQSTYEYREHV